MKPFFLILFSLFLTSCMDITIPDFKSEEKLPEDEKGEEVEDNSNNEEPHNDENESEPTTNNTYPLITSATIPNEFVPFVSLFAFYGKILEKNLDYSKLIIEYDTNINAHATCSKINNNQNELIKINPTYWAAFSSAYKEMLIFHEMGHCFLGRSHLGNSFTNPSSLMNTTVFNESVYIQRYNELIYELFEIPASSDYEFIFGELTPHE